MSVEWLDRALVDGPFLALCTSDAEYREAVAHMDVDGAGPWLNPGADATMHTFVTEAGNLACLVCLGNTEGHTGPQVAAMLVHEAVHVWQQFRDSIGEKAPSSEFEAYSIQAIAQRLMEQYSRILEAKG